MENEKLYNLGQRIRYFRNKLDLSQEALAFKCEVDRTYISLLERGKGNPSLLNLLKISNGLEISLSKLFAEMSQFNNIESKGKL